MRISLIVTTYERPDALACVLESVRRQSFFPDELVVADDGSGEETRQVIEHFRGEVSFPVKHAWQPHEGFRVCRARNMAIAQTSGDYIVQIDGDMVLHPRFLADHRAAARPGCFVQGTRILLDARQTNEVVTQGPRTFSAASAGLGGLRRLYAWRSALASKMLRIAANEFIAIKSCNQAFWREDLVRVNGYNEAMTGWGCDDKELAARLMHAGVRLTTLLFAGIAYHLRHQPASRERWGINKEILAHTHSTGAVRCALGLDHH